MKSTIAIVETLSAKQRVRHYSQIIEAEKVELTFAEQGLARAKAEFQEAKDEGPEPLREARRLVSSYAARRTHVLAGLAECRLNAARAQAEVEAEVAAQ